jgi:sec-independent protein translocase protein TatA
VLFGSKKLPDAARGLGRSMRIFRAEMQSTQHDDAAPAPAATAPAPVEDAVAARPTSTSPESPKPAVDH